MHAGEAVKSVAAQPSARRNPTLRRAIFFRSISTIRGTGRLFVACVAPGRLPHERLRQVAGKRGFTFV
jgi:hypothetical protein